MKNVFYNNDDASNDHNWTSVIIIHSNVRYIGILVIFHFIYPFYRNSINSFVHCSCYFFQCCLRFFSYLLCFCFAVFSIPFVFRFVDLYLVYLNLCYCFPYSFRSSLFLFICICFCFWFFLEFVFLVIIY